MSTRSGPVQFTDLPDEILLRIFAHFATVQQESTEHIQNENESLSAFSTPQVTSQGAAATSNLSGLSETVAKSDPSTKQSKRKKTTNGKIRIAGPGPRTLCRLCCCSHRFNHLASTDQLWQPLTLARFPDRHWPTTDQKNLELIRVRREHQLKLLQPSSTAASAIPSDDLETQSTQQAGSDAVSVGSGLRGDKAFDQDMREDQNMEGDASQRGEQDGQHKKQKRTKFYSRFEQRAHRRKFASLDPALKFTPLEWTNTLWSWKRTFFGDCRFVESKDVSTPNRIDHAIHRNNADTARQECERCWRPARSCICSALTSQQYCNCRVRIMILQHPRCQVSIGTIRILKMSFKYCQIVIGKDFKAGRSLELDQALEDPNCTPLLLYPSYSAVDIQSLAPKHHSPSSRTFNTATTEEHAHSRYFCQDCIHCTQNYTTKAEQSSPSPTPSTSGASTGYPYKLIIALDGSWSHAKIMYRCNPRLQQLTQVKFPNPPQSIYHELKPEPKATYTSTAEAMGQAVALLGWPEGMRDNTRSLETTDAQLLLKDLIRPLRKMIEIQDAIAQDQQKQQEQDQDVLQE